MPQEPLVTPARVFIGLGSNIEPRLGHLRDAISKLRTIGEVVKISPVYETEPVGGVPQAEYLNAAIELRTRYGPLDLLERLHEFEVELGRRDRPRWHEREIDFDILLYDDVVFERPELVIPHPEIARRAFVLAPLADLDATIVHPVLHRTIGELLGAVVRSGIRRTEFELD